MYCPTKETEKAVVLAGVADWCADLLCARKPSMEMKLDPQEQALNVHPRSCPCRIHHCPAFLKMGVWVWKEGKLK